MDSTALIVLIVCIAVVVVLAGTFLYLQRRRSGTLKKDFGQEYERTVRNRGSQTKAERELEARRKRVEALDIRPLSRENADRFRNEWRDVQAKFVDEPQAAINDADRLLNDVLQTRGYPVGDFERRAEDLSVNHPNVVANYRKAHGIATAKDNGVEPETEQLRQAMVHYRSLFEELVGEAPSEQRRAS